MTFHREPRLKVADASVKRFKEKVRELMRKGKGQNIGKLVEELQPLIRGWIAYFKWAEVKSTLEELDGWIRRRLRCVLWRQGNRVYARARRLMSRGIAKDRAMISATNGRGPWWNAGASHMNEAFPSSYFDTLGLPSLLQERQRLQLTTSL